MRKNHLEKVHLVKSQGFSLAIDDFGTGYSGVNYLKNYPVDFIKIDRSFISSVDSSEMDKTLLKILVDMTHALDLVLIVEGIETRAQLDYLISLNCECTQGFLMARPMPFQELVTFFVQPSFAPPTSK